jgi:hypothetical protein
MKSLKDCLLESLSVDVENLSKKENTYKMREEAHKQIVEMAGIEQNMWPCDAD